MISKKTGTMILAGAVLVIAGVIVTSMLLATKPSIVQINDGSFKIIELPYTYTKNDAFVLVIGSSIAGMILSYILTMFFPGQSEVKEMITTEKTEEITLHGTAAGDEMEHVNDSAKLVEAVLAALVGDEKKLVKEIADHGGEMLQNELVLTLNFSKAKVSRMLTDLETRKLVVKKQYGLTNKIALDEKLRGERNEK